MIYAITVILLLAIRHYKKSKSIPDKAMPAKLFRNVWQDCQSRGKRHSALATQLLLNKCSSGDEL